MTGTDRALLPPAGAIAVIFISQRTDEDAEGYGMAAATMEVLAATQPGYLGIDAARDGDGFGITVSYWADEASALAWRANAEHAAVRALGRARWYAHYRMIVTRIARAYAWRGDGAPPAG